MDDEGPSSRYSVYGALLHGEGRWLEMQVITCSCRWDMEQGAPKSITNTLPNDVHCWATVMRSHSIWL